MKEYIVKKGFMAFQFDEGLPVYSIGIEVNALAQHEIYKCIVGKEKREIIVGLSDVDRLIKKYGTDKVIKKVSGKKVYIIPVREIEK